MKDMQERSFVQENHQPLADSQTQVGQSVCRGASDIHSGVARRLTFREAVAIAGDQIGIGEIPRSDPSWPILHDMCRVMAEAYVAHPRMRMDVGRESYEADLVASVYREITPLCAQELASRLVGKMGGIQHIKAYLRMALYNAVFEYESVALREVKQDNWWE